jgi:GntR family transcriptional regulator
MNLATKAGAGESMASKRKWEVLAELLAGEIEAGKYKPGDRLPTVEALELQHAVANITVRNAIIALVQRGLVRTEQGSGTYVRADERLRLDMTKIESVEHRAVHRDFDAWTSDVRRAGFTPSQEFDLGLKSCPADLAGVFGVDEGSVLTIRRCNRFVDEQPSMIETSYFPAWLVDELPRLREPVDIEEGTTLYLAEHGYPIDHRMDQISGRPQTREEQSFLQLPFSEWMLARISPAYIPDGRVARFMVSVYPAAKYTLVYQVGGGFMVKPNQVPGGDAE